MPTPHKRRRPEIPDWLREKPKRNFPWVPLTLAAALLITTTVVTYVLMHTPPSVLSDVQVADSGEKSKRRTAAPEVGIRFGRRRWRGRCGGGDEARSRRSSRRRAGDGRSRTDCGRGGRSRRGAARCTERLAGAGRGTSTGGGRGADNAFQPASPLRPASNDESVLDTDIPAGDVATMPAAGTPPSAASPTRHSCRRPNDPKCGREQGPADAVPGVDW